MQDENQREINLFPIYPADSTFFTAANQPPGNRKSGEYKGQKGIFTPKKNTDICNYCKKVGHNISQCYKIHGFPPDFKFTKGKRTQTAALASSRVDPEQARPNVADPLNLTQENI